jgi:hypothetical protein
MMRTILAMPVMSKNTNIPSSQKLKSGQKSKATAQDTPSAFGSSTKSQWWQNPARWCAT